MLGHTNPKFADPGTIRGDFGQGLNANICHGSDSKHSAEREIQLWFGDDEMIKVDDTLEEIFGKIIGDEMRPGK